jgi:hypothetical protein
LTDLGSSDGVEFVLGRCTACGRPWIHLWSALAPTARYVTIDARDAAWLQEMPAGPARKRAVAAWFASR